MTERRFSTDPYQREFDAKVVSVRGNVLVLDKTCFYAESGGQPGDTGTINGIPVTDTKFDADNKTIFHYLASPSDITEDALVHGSIDWDRRYKLMRLHSALHICYLVFNKIYGNHPLRGSNVAENKGRLDYAFFNPIDPALLQNEIAEIVATDLSIHRSFADAEGAWKIENYEEVPCGGTHPQRTGEIGTVACKIKKLGKQGQRIYVSLP